MNVRNAIAKIMYSMSEEYEFWLDCLETHEMREEIEELKEAYEIVSEHNIVVTKEMVEKRKTRALNRVPEPVRFIDRPHFIPVDVDELPF